MFALAFGLGDTSSQGNIIEHGPCVHTHKHKPWRLEATFQLVEGGTTNSYTHVTDLEDRSSRPSCGLHTANLCPSVCTCPRMGSHSPHKPCYMDTVWLWRHGKHQFMLNFPDAHKFPRCSFSASLHSLPYKKVLQETEYLALKHAGYMENSTRLTGTVSSF